MIVLKEDPALANSLRFNMLTQRVDVVKKLWWNDRITSLTDEGEEFLLCNSKNKTTCYAGGGQIFRYKYELLCYHMSGSAKPQKISTGGPNNGHK
ncbi:MAG: hypothetical protein UHU19_06905 [Lachnospiraceae bacterium]|nr:hypothetical protein [Lachnospiraceae bacterium]